MCFLRIGKVIVIVMSIAISYTNSRRMEGKAGNSQKGGRHAKDCEHRM